MAKEKDKTQVITEVTIEPRDPLSLSVHEAFCAAQCEMTSASRNAANPHFGKTYADLASVQAACFPALHEYGFSIVQRVMTTVIDGNYERFVRTTFLHHTGDDSISCDVEIILDKPTMQRLGSAITYARRYGLMCLAGVAPADDDANAADSGTAGSGGSSGTTPPARSRGTTSQIGFITESMIDEILIAADANPLFAIDVEGITNRDVLRAFVEVIANNRLGGLRSDHGTRLLGMLKEKQAEGDLDQKQKAALQAAKLKLKAEADEK